MDMYMNTAWWLVELNTPKADVLPVCVYTLPIRLIHSYVYCTVFVSDVICIHEPNLYSGKRERERDRAESEPRASPSPSSSYSFALLSGIEYKWYGYGAGVCGPAHTTSNEKLSSGFRVTLLAHYVEGQYLRNVCAVREKYTVVRAQQQGSRTRSRPLPRLHSRALLSFSLSLSVVHGRRSSTLRS